MYIMKVIRDQSENNGMGGSTVEIFDKLKFHLPHPTTPPPPPPHQYFLTGALPQSGQGVTNLFE